MTRLLRALILVLLAPFPALAQIVDIRGGDHDGFTRLVFALPEAVQWSMTPSPAGNAYILEIDGGVTGFELDKVFSRIDRSRIAAVRQLNETSSVLIELACACQADTSVLGERMLIVDIMPEAGLPKDDAVPVELADDPGENEPLQGAEPKPQDERMQQQAQDIAPEPVDDAPMPDAADLAQLRTDGRPGIGPGREPSPLMPSVPFSQSAQPDVAQAAGDLPPEALPTPRPVSIGEQIIANLAAAATQGLLEPALQPVASRPPEPEKPKPAPAHLATDLAQQLAEGLSGLDHEARGPQHVAIGGVNCVSDKALRFMNWVPPEVDPFEYMSNARGAVFGEFDRVEPEALRTYIKSLIYFGFGTEAQSAAELDPQAIDPILMALSDLVDLKDDPTDVFANQTDCEGMASVWSLLDMTQLPNGGSINTEAILRNFESLPKGLREHLGPRLVDKLSHYGKTDTARDLLRRLERTSGEETDKIALERAKLDVQEGRANASAKTLQDLAFKPGPESIEAVKAAVDLAEQTEQRIPSVMVDLAAAYATEFRNTDEGPNLWQTHMRMLLLNGRFDDAFGVLEDSKGIPKDLVHDMGDYMLEALLPSEDEVSFLKYAFRLDSTGHRTTQPELDLAVARRMLDLGLSEAVLERVDRINVDESTEEVRLLKARAYLQLSQPEEAESYLVGLRGTEADQLRAEIRALMGDYEFAKSLFARIGQDEAALQAAWLAGDWQDVSEANEPAFAPTADLVQSDQTVVDPAALSLNAAEQLTVESSNARDTLRALLDATRISQED